MFYFEINWFNCSHFQLHSCIFLFSVLPPSVKLSLSAHTQGCVPNMTILGVFTLVDIQIHDCKNNNSKWAFRAFKAWVCSSRRLLEHTYHYLIIWNFGLSVFGHITIQKRKRKTSRLGINIYTYTAVNIKISVPVRVWYKVDYCYMTLQTPKWHICMHLKKTPPVGISHFNLHRCCWV